jgi:short-subunit dehydrogenase
MSTPASNRPALLLVGAGPGLGLAIARRFGREGFHLIGIARRPATLGAWAEALRADGLSCEPVAADAADGPRLATLIGALAVGHMVGVLVYNAAGREPQGMPSSLEAQALQSSLQVSALSALAAAQALLPGMRARGWGSLLFTGGGYALEPAARLSALALGKAALRSLALSLYEELRPAGLHAATVTVCGAVQPAGSGGVLAADAIAEHYWQLHLQKPQAFERERLVGR